jgi:hypothetical protein
MLVQRLEQWKNRNLTNQKTTEMAIPALGLPPLVALMLLYRPSNNLHSY